MWLVFGRRVWIVRLIVVIACVPAIAYGTRLGDGVMPMNTVGWYALACALAAAIVVGSLLN